MSRRQWAVRVLPGNGTALVVDLVEVRRLIQTHAPGGVVHPSVQTIETSLSSARVYTTADLRAIGVTFPAAVATATGLNDGSRHMSWVLPPADAASRLSDVAAEESLGGTGAVCPRQLPAAEVVLAVGPGDPLEVRAVVWVDVLDRPSSIHRPLPDEFLKTAEDQFRAQESTAVCGRAGVPDQP